MGSKHPLSLRLKTHDKWNGTSYYFNSKSELHNYWGVELGVGSIIRSYSNKRLSNKDIISFSIPSDLHPIIIGLILGDLYIEKRPNYARLVFGQGYVNKDYAYHLFELFSKYISMEKPYHYEYLDKRTDKIYTSIKFKTYSLLCFNEFHSLFYVNGKKIIPNNIEELLTPAGLAYWAMDDGNKFNKNFKFSTNSYTKEEVQLLINALKNKFDLDCSIHNFGKEQFTIYIKSNSMDKFKDLVSPYFHDSMRYKLD